MYFRPAADDLCCPAAGTQWHPEKPTSEFGMPEVPHTLDAIRVSQHLANQFIDMARYNSHTPESPEQELAMLIYSTPPIFSARFEVRLSDCRRRVHLVHIIMQGLSGLRLRTFLLQRAVCC